ncbi:unnamed protein product [Camellia sinensis]
MVIDRYFDDLDLQLDRVNLTQIWSCASSKANFSNFVVMAIGIDDRSSALLSNGGDERHNNEIRDLGHRRPRRVP